ncbi:uracil-DNA glycosylase [Ulvibacter antarcticus]|uniref:Uracil-DNA glycosylase n=1 Tax=Ulvibacter antarcticus TaxID=442714 RepID=A0A3L9Z1N5_9FLAO|nr:uracil-DNA glycosylase [Ulvibacter antarcticus]RMA64258.1 uracil-DNA glycosylase [Ulvibacter antarcticus]
MDVKLPSDWQTVLNEEISKDYFQNLIEYITTEYENNICYPPVSQVFSSLKHTKFKDVKVVILGQDPYHNPSEANGLAFSVNDGIRIPPSLRNIYKELNNNLQKEIPKSGNLEDWANQGVLLLNSILTVRENDPGSHRKKGWEEFTDAVIDKLAEDRKDLVFLLWGNYAKNKGKKIDKNQHLVLESSHPSPLSANRGGWFNKNVFSETNKYLTEKGKTPIKW